MADYNYDEESGKAEKFARAFGKLKTRDKVIILVVFALVVSVICGSALYFLLKLDPWKEVVWPESTLSQFDEFQTYSKKSINNLKNTVRFLDSPYTIDVGGTEQYPYDDGDAFLLDSGDYIFVSLQTSEDIKISDIASARTLLYTFNLSEEATFTSMVSGSGYLNTLYLDYEGGEIVSSIGTYYMLAYRYVTDEGYVLFWGTLTDNLDNLEDDKKIIDNMLYTIGELKQEAMDAIAENSSSTESSTEDVITSYDPNDPESVAAYYEQKHENIANIQASIDNESYTHSETIEKTITVTDKYSSEDCYFVFLYDRVESTPGFAYLTSPDGTVYEPYDMNTSGNGRVLFSVEKPMEGDWIVTVAQDHKYGMYDYYVTTVEEYNSLLEFEEEKEDISPRIAEDE